MARVFNWVRLDPGLRLERCRRLRVAFQFLLRMAPVIGHQLCGVEIARRFTARLGRGDGYVGDWLALRAQSKDAENGGTAVYLLGLPQLSDYLEECLSLPGEACDGDETTVS